MYKEILDKYGLGELTIKQKEALMKILDFADDNSGLFPSLRDVRTAIGLSSISEADRYYRILIRKGYLEPITDEDGQRMSRGCRISPAFKQAMEEAKEIENAG